MYAVSHEPDVIVVGAGLAGLVATHELAKAGRRVLVARPGEPRTTSAARRSGRSAGCSSSTAPSSAGWASRTPTSWRCRTGWVGASSTASDEDHWPRAVGRGLRRLRRRREARATCATLGLRVAPGRRLGRARRRPRARARQLGARASTSPGAPAPGSCASFAEPVLERPSAQGWSRFAFRHQVDELVVEDGAVVGVRGTVLGRRRRRARRDVQPRRRPASFELRAAGRRRHDRRHRPQPRPDPAQLARRAARHRAPEHMITGVPAHVDGRMLGITEARRRDASSTATGCGTTSRASTTGTRSGPTTRSGSCPARRRCGSTRPGERLAGSRASPASTPSAR